MKAAAAAGVATVVWSEPTIKGLARRPAYASGGSQPVSGPVTITGTINGTTFSNLMWSPTEIAGDPPTPIVLTPTVIDDLPALALPSGGLLTFINPIGDPDGVLEFFPITPDGYGLLFQAELVNQPFTINATLQC